MTELARFYVDRSTNHWNVIDRKGRWVVAVRRTRRDARAIARRLNAVKPEQLVTAGGANGVPND